MSRRKNQGFPSMRGIPGPYSNPYEGILSDYLHGRQDPVYDDRDIFDDAWDQDEYLDEPDGDYGVRIVFVGTFIREDMEDAFIKASVEFIKKEPMIKDEAIFHDLPLPYKEENLRSSYIYSVLGMMLTCALKGSSFSAGILLELYKGYYKKEYNVIKRFKKISMYDYTEAFDYEDNGNEESNVCAARMVIMCRLLNIEMDNSWKVVHNILNDNEYNDRMVWRSIEAIVYGESDRETERKKRGKCAAWVTEHFPEMASPKVYGDDDRYELTEMLESVIEATFEDQEIRVDGLMSEKIDLYDDAVGALCNGAGYRYMRAEREGLVKKWSKKKNDDSEIKAVDIPIKEDEYTLREMVMMSYVHFLASRLGQLYKMRQDELRQMFDIKPYEVVGDDDLENEYITKEMLSNVKKVKEGITETDARDDKVMDKITGLEAPEEKDGAETRKSVPDSMPKKYPLGSMEETVQSLKAELADARKQAEINDKKAENQRALYEQSREKVKALEKDIEKYTDEHAELVALRELIHSIESEKEENYYQTESISIDEMIAELNDVKGVVIGGHESWANKLKRKLTKWTFIPAGESLNLDRALGKSEVAFIYTDVMAHKMYYRMMGTIRSLEIPFHFIHGVNIDKVIMTMYEQIIG